MSSTIMKKILYSIAIAISATSVYGQTDQDTTFSRNVNIIREYLPTINDAGKINTLPRIEEIENRKTDINYSTWASPLNSTFNLQTLPAATLKKIKQNRALREGYARIGGGNYLSFLGDIYLPVLRGESYQLDFYAKHLSAFGEVKQTDSTKTQAKNMMNSAQLAFTKNFYSINLLSELNYHRNDFNYYGKDTLNQYAESVFTLDDLKPEKDAIQFFDFKLGIVSKPKLGGMNYAISSKYALTNTNSGLNESQITTKGYLKSNMEQNEYGINIALDNLLYAKSDSTPLLFNDINRKLENYSVLELSPYYTIEEKTWNLRIGLKSYFSFNKGQAAYAAPDLVGNLTIIRDLFYLYGALGGDVKINSMQNILKENRYMRPDILIEDTYTPLDANAGIKIKFFDQLVLNGFIGYKYINNQYFFVNRNMLNTGWTGYNNTFDVVYDEVGVFNTGASINYNLNKKIDFLLKGIYNSWNMDELQYAFHKPEWQIDFDAAYKINEDIQISFNSHVLGKRYALGIEGNSVELKPIFDCSISGMYEYNSWISAFVKINNLLAQNYEIWNGYNSHGFNALAGVMFSF